MRISCNIVFDNNPDRIYYGGQTLSGTATVDVRETIPLPLVIP